MRIAESDVQVKLIPNSVQKLDGIFIKRLQSKRLIKI
jgi:hypothetical protein